MIGAADDPRDGRLQPLGRTPELLYRTEYTQLVGSRIRRLREERGWLQMRLAGMLERPRGNPVSAGLISRMERGMANPPLYVYVHVAAAFELDPAVLMGPRAPEDPVGEAEMTLLRFMRRMGITADEALARIAAGSPEGSVS